MKTILHGHCIDELRKLPANHFHVCVTSPPYYGLRNYGTKHQRWEGTDPNCKHKWRSVVKKKTSGSKDGSTLEGFNDPGDGNAGTRADQPSKLCVKCDAWIGELGQEPTPQLYITHLIQVFAEIHRVLRPDGILWVNIADSFAAGGHGGGGGSYSEQKKQGEKCGGPKGRKPPACWNLKKKDKMLIPARLSIALQEWGWWVRQDHVWSKPNPLRESVQDRCTTSHEFIFQLTKSEQYFSDFYAIKEPVKKDSIARILRGRNEHKNSNGAPGQPPHSFVQPDANMTGLLSFDGISAAANRLSVWTITVASYKGAHFATYPAELPELCIRASTSDGGCCAKCGKPYARVLENLKPDFLAQKAAGGNELGLYFGKSRKNHTKAGVQDASATKARILKGMIVRKTIGFKPMCKCNAGSVPCRVLDPFFGSGTTGEVSLTLNRDVTGIELNPEYLPFIAERTSDGKIQPTLTI
jgi:DNA modification methylase